MFRAIVESQWRTTKGFVLLLTLVSFGIPLFILSMGGLGLSAMNLVNRMEETGVLFALASAGLGLGVAMFAWGQDHRGRHVYALTLPVERARYAAMRFGAGLLFLTPPAMAVLAGGALVAVSGAVPVGLHVYPIAIAIRFLVAAAVAYAVFFAISSSTPKTAGIILGVGVGLIVLQLLLEAVHVRFDLIDRLGDVVYARPGVLSIFVGRWMLIDA